MSSEPRTVERRTVGVVVERRKSDSRWVDHVWQPVAVLPGAPDTAPWTVLHQDERVTRYYAGPAELTLFPGETEVYKHNVESAEPAVYVVLRKAEHERGVDLLLATIDPGEAHAHADTGDDLLERLPAPPEILAWQADFVARHHVERTKWRRQRDRADPEALATGRHRRDMDDEDG